MHTLPHVLGWVMSQVWAILPAYREAFVSTLVRRGAGETWPAEAIRATLDAALEARDAAPERLLLALEAAGMFPTQAAGGTLDPGAHSLYANNYQAARRINRSPAPGVGMVEVAAVGDEVRHYAPAISAAEVSRARGEFAAPRDHGSGIMVLSLRGLINHRVEDVADTSGPGGTSAERFGQRFRTAIEDDDVGSIVIDTDSPGGNVAGLRELASDMRSLRGRKPVVAVANTHMTSGALWIAAQADEIVVTPSADIGSVGAFGIHEDITEALAMQGVKVEIIRSGVNKARGSPVEALDDDTRAVMQERVEAAGLALRADLAAGRGLTVAQVVADFGEGLVFGAAEAVGLGMADRVDTLEGTFRRLSEAPGRETVMARSARRAAVPVAPSAAPAPPGGYRPTRFAFDFI